MVTPTLWLLLPIVLGLAIGICIAAGLVADHRLTTTRTTCKGAS